MILLNRLLMYHVTGSFADSAGISLTRKELEFKLSHLYGVHIRIPIGKGKCEWCGYEQAPKKVLNSE